MYLHMLLLFYRCSLSGAMSPRHGLQMLMAVANTLNKQSRTADKRWSSSLSFGRGLTTPHSWKPTC